MKGILTKDFMVLRGDKMTTCNLNELIDYHYISKNDLTTTLCEKIQTKKKGFDIYKGIPNICLIMDRKRERILNYLNKQLISSFGNNKMTFQRSLIKRHREMDIITDYISSEIYICNFKILNLMSETCEFYTEIELDLLPFIVKY